MPVSTDDNHENLTAYRFRWIGYGFLLFALIDAIHIVLTVPLGTTTPLGANNGILQMIGLFVERAVVPLIGFTLVFFGEYYGRRDLEKFGLKLLSWLCLVLAILFFLMAPGAIAQAVMSRSQVDQQVNVAVDQGTKAVDQQLARLNQIESQLAQSSPEDLQRLATQLSSAGVSVDPNNPNAVKATLQERIKTEREQLQVAKAQGRSKVEQEASGQWKTLFKNAIKWSLGSILAGVLFTYLWRSSRWAR